MNVDLGLVGEVEVEHVGDVFNVNAATGDVGGHEDEHVAVPERFQCTRPCGLALVAVDGIRRNPNFAQLFSKAVCAVLGSGEHDAASHHLALEQIDEQLTLVRFLDESHVLFDAIGGRCLGTDVNVHRTVQHLVGQLADGLGHGRTEHQVLSLARNEGEDAFNVLAEAHVEHAVSLVKDKVFHLAQVNVALLVQVEQTAGCRNEHVHTASERLDLRRLPDPAENDGGIQREVAAVHAQAVADLRR